jgi:glutathione S-transferase
MNRKIPYRYQEINPYKKEPSFLKLNPRGLVPTLGCPTTEGEQPLIESGIICDYLDETFPETPLYPKDAFKKAKLRVSIDYVRFQPHPRSTTPTDTPQVTSRIIPAYHRFLQHTPSKSYTLESARAEFLNSLLTFIKDADPKGPFFAGSEFSMPDVILAPWAVRLWVFDHFKEGGLGIPEPGKGDENEALWERWRVWAKAVAERQSVVETLSDREHYLPLYQRYHEDKAQSEVSRSL